MGGSTDLEFERLSREIDVEQPSMSLAPCHGGGRGCVPCAQLRQAADHTEVLPKVRNVFWYYEDISDCARLCF